MRTLQQDLTFEKAEAVFKRYKVEFSEEKFITLGLRNIHDDQYTNLALLISDQCQHTIKIAVFGDAENITLRTLRSLGAPFSNSLMKAMTTLHCVIALSLPFGDWSESISKTIQRRLSVRLC